jgi:tRNA(Ile)-lysidine synthase
VTIVSPILPAPGEGLGSDDLAAAVLPAFPDGDLVVALSGGPDSAVAAHLATLAEPPRSVRAVFVDHQWPGSARQRAAASAIADRLHIDLDVVLVAPSTTETAARPLRMTALTEAAGNGVIVTGHHADDVAETVILNLVRGAGSAGLGSIPAERPPFARPLLGVSRATLRRVAEELCLPFADDPANQDIAHRRNAVRSRVLPSLEALAPGAGAALSRSAQLLAADDELLDAAAAAVPLRAEPGAIRIPAAALTMLSPPVASRVVRRAVRSLRPPYPGEMADVTKTFAAVTGPPSNLSGGLRCEREGAFVVIHDPALSPSPAAACRLEVPGGCTSATHIVAARRVDVGPAHRGRGVATVGSELAESLVVRSAEPGERIDIGTGSKLVRDAMAEGGVPPRLREAWPVVARHGKIVWIVGIRVSAGASPPPGGVRILELTTERIGCWTI